MFIVPLSQLPSIFPKQEQLPEQPKANSVPFVDMLKDSLANMQEQRAVADRDSVDLSLGNMDDLHTMGINATKASVATTFTAQLATRAINAYNEILRIQA